MSKPPIADAGWHELLIEKLEGVLKLAQATRSDLAHMEMCDGSGCERMFDGRDPRKGTVLIAGIEHHFCPGCEFEAQNAAGGPQDEP